MRESTIAGMKVLTVYLANREDFVAFVRALRWSSEPYPLPESVGAMTIYGARDQNRVEDVRRAWVGRGGERWDSQLKAILAVPQFRKYLAGTVIALSKGPYSHVTAEEVKGLLPGENEMEFCWETLSLKIREAHEQAHVYSRSRYPQNKEALRDEVLADAVGLVNAIGRYDAPVAERLIGIKNGQVVDGGRLFHYLSPEEEVQRSVSRVRRMIDAVARFSETQEALDPFELLERMEREGVALDVKEA